MKINIISAVLATAVLLGSSSVFAENTNVIPQINASENITEHKSPIYISPEIESNYHDPYYMSLFENICDLYIKNHLYTFDELTLYKETFLKLFDENPQLFYPIMQTLLSTMDRYSSIHPPESNYLSVDSLGYGITVLDCDKETSEKTGMPEGIYVDKVYDGSNAQIAGIQSGDRIKSVLGLSLEGIDFNASMSIIRNSVNMLIDNQLSAGDVQKDQAVNHCDFIVSRKDELTGLYKDIEISMSVGKVIFSELSTTLYEQENVALISISSFLTETIAQEFKQQLDEIYNAGYRKLTIDLRGNGGGRPDSALEMANMLIAQKDLVLYHIKSRDTSTPTPVYSSGGGYTFDKINVLIDQNTASAAELFALIMRDINGAKIIGKTSTGKFIGQKSYNFLTGDNVSVTAFEILSADMTAYDKIGLTPDYECPIVEEKYILQPLPWFNHQNYLDLQIGVNNETVLGLEQRLSILNILRESYVDGIYDIYTQNAIKIFQALAQIPITGVMDDQFVTIMTTSINRYKNYYTTSDTQLDVALMCHKNYSQAKRLAAECRNAQQLIDDERAAYQQALIDEYNADMEREWQLYMEEKKKKEQEKEQQEQQEQQQKPAIQQ